MFKGIGVTQLRGNLCSKTPQTLSLVVGRVDSNIVDLCVLLRKSHILGRQCDEPTRSGGSLKNAVSATIQWVEEVSQRKIVVQNDKNNNKREVDAEQSN